MTEPYVPDPADLELVTHTLFQGSLLRDDESDRLAHEVLTALHAAGRLLPTGGEERTEGAYLINGKDYHSVGWSSAPRTHQRKVIVWPIEGLANDYWPRYLGPWVAVDEGSGTA